MYSGFTSADAHRRGIGSAVIRSALDCCVERISAATYHVAAPCRRHRAIAAFADDADLATAQRGRQQEATDAQRRAAAALRHLSALAASSLAAGSNVIGGGSAAVIHDLPLIRSSPPPLHRSPRRVRRGTFSPAGPRLGADRGQALWRRLETIETWHPTQSRRVQGLVRRMGLPPEEHTIRWQERMIVDPLWTAVDISRTRSVCDGIAAMDVVLGRDQSISRGQALVDYLSEWSHLRNMRCALRAAAWSTGLAESPAESLCLYVLRALGFEDVQQQVLISDPFSRPIGRVDHLLTEYCDEPTIVEVDGAVKYLPAELGGFAGPGESLHASSSAVIAEKRREDRLRAAGYRVVRLTWHDLLRPEAVVEALEAAGVSSRYLSWESLPPTPVDLAD